MSLSLGTNSGFVTVAPTADPTGGTTNVIDGVSAVTKHTSPSTAVKIVKIGWWCNEATEEANFEVGLYAADGTVVPGEAGTLLHVSRTNAKGTNAGWKVVTGLNWAININTAYWIATQCDATSTTTRIDLEVSGGAGVDSRGGGSGGTLPDPFGGGELTDADAMYAIYAVWEAAAFTPKRRTILNPHYRM